jgi:hypothetical protein
MAVDVALSAKITEAADADLTDCAKYLFFDESGCVLASSFKVSQSSLE